MAEPQGKPAMPRTITVTASGTAEADPDQARITSGVTSEAETARAAMDANSQTMTKLIAGLKDAGIEARDIQTSNLNISPRYDNQQRREGPPVVIGYQVSNEVAVLVRDLKNLGEVLDRAVTLGANQMRGLSFEVSKAETLRDAARTDAIANARRRAELYAKAAGASVGKVLDIAEGSGNPGSPRPMYARAAKLMESVPVEAGSETLTASVTVTWELID